jgi:LDH2 family malate/lactate/ureidoglycolate dehydrogenase
MKSSARVIVPSDELAELVSACFEHVGIGREDAEAVASALLYANLREIDSHGFERVPVYMRRVSAGLAGGTERLTVVAEHGAFCCLDAGHGLGPAVGVKASDRAAALARRHGVGLATVRNATNFGAAGFYALRLARAQLIGLVATNAPKMMAPYGAAEAFLGSNPIAVAIPLGRNDEFVLDMSSTIVARGKVRRAKAKGERLAPGLALDAAGRPTTNATQALAGTLLPIGGPKGSGLALAVSLIVAMLAGAEFDHEVASMYADDDRAQNLGQLFVAIDPSHVSGGDSWAARTDSLVGRLHELRTQPGVERARYPGEASAARARRRAREGISLEVSEIEEAACACRDCGAVALAARMTSLAESATAAHT